MKTGCSFGFGLWDVSAVNDAKLATTSSQAFADVQSANGGNDRRELPQVATPDWVLGWMLDGSTAPLPDNAEDYPWGWWSAEPAGDDCSFAVPPVLVVEFADSAGNVTLHSSVGITLSFAGVLPRDLLIRWYGENGDLLAEGEFCPDSAEYFCDMAVENYARVEIEVPAMSWPRCYLRLVNVLFGCYTTLGDNDVISAELTDEVDVSGNTLPISEMKLSFYTPNGRFALLNPAGQYQYFQYRQKLAAYQTIDGVERKLGEYYLKSAEATVDEVTKLNCVDIIGILDGEEYKGGYFENVPLADVLSELLAPLDVGFEICPELAAKSVTGWIAPDSVRAALQRIVFTVGGYVRIDGDGKIRILTGDSECIAIGADRKVMGHKVTMNELVTGVTVTSYSWREESSRSEVWRGELTVGEHEVYFDEPVRVVSAVGAEVIEIFERLNGCRLNVSADGEVVISGYAFEVTEQEHSRDVAGVPVGTRQNIKRFDGVKTMTVAGAEEAAERLCEYYQRRYSDEGMVLPGDEFAGAMVELASLGGMSVVGQIERLSVDLTGGGLQTIKIVGIAK